ncbi:MAG: M4 family metallopeptidase [Kofleriaceae bacterium]
MSIRNIFALPLAFAAACSSTQQPAPPSDAVEQSLTYLEQSDRAAGVEVREALQQRALRRDDQGVTHVRFAQTHRGVPVFEGEVITHVDAAGQVTETSALRAIGDLSVVPVITQAHAAQLARQAPFAAGRASEAVSLLQILPRGERSAVDRLTWHVMLRGEDAAGPMHWDVFVDAHSGKVVWAFDSLETSAAIGLGKTAFTGDNALDTDSSGGTFLLRDLTRGGGNYTCDKNGKTNSPQCTIIDRANNIFGNNQPDLSDRATAGADAHFGLQATWDYYLGTFGRNGIDGAGTTTFSRVHYGRNYQNAFWSDSCFCMTYGDGGTTFMPLVSLDVAGHEMSHGVMSTEANLTYSGESGGLNESNSDIFGTMVEYAVNSTDDVPDYLIGERIFRANYAGGTYVNNAALRYMDDPARDGRSPACWSSGLGSLDVHYSSGPNNHMFYLLAEGGVSKCNGNTVAGIGRDHAARIWYKAVTDFMTASTNYAGARAAALSAATALYGAGSADVAAVAAAYAAINVN